MLRSVPAADFPRILTRQCLRRRAALRAQFRAGNQPGRTCATIGHSPRGFFPFAPNTDRFRIGFRERFRQIRPDKRRHIAAAQRENRARRGRFVGTVRAVDGEDGYFGERAAASYDPSAAEMSEPGVLEPGAFTGESRQHVSVREKP